MPDFAYVEDFFFGFIRIPLILDGFSLFCQIVSLPNLEDPDGVCVELCERRVMAMGLREQAHRIRGSTSHFLRQNMAKELRKQSTDGMISPEEGVELALAFLEAHRSLKPCYLVDRDVKITRERYNAAPHAATWLGRYFPRLHNLGMLIRLLRAASKTGQAAIPEAVVREMFQEGLFERSWTWRRDILESAKSMGMKDGEKMVPLKSFFIDEKVKETQHDDQMTMPPELGGMLGSESKFEAMPPDLREMLGPETETDVFMRIVGFERDVIMARNIRGIHKQVVEFAAGGLNGPLVLAVLGAAHIQGVAHHLKLPMWQLEQEIAKFQSYDAGESGVGLRPPKQQRL